MVISRNTDGSYSAFQNFMGKRFVIESESMAEAMTLLIYAINRHYREMRSKEHADS